MKAFPPGQYSRLSLDNVLWSGIFKLTETMSNVTLFIRNAGMVQRGDRGNTARQLFKEEEPLIELSMRRYEVDQHWCDQWLVTRRFRSVPRSCPRRLSGLGPVFASSLALKEEGCVTHTHGDICWGGSRAAGSAEAATGNQLETHPAYKRNLFLLLSHSHALLLEERMSHVASTGSISIMSR
jgi:hypothetical protein